MNFNVDLGAPRTSTFEAKDFVPDSLKLFDEPTVLPGISGSLAIKGHGNIKFQVVMDSEIVKEITAQAYKIPGVKYRLFSP